MRIKEITERIITGKYNDARFWRYRHAICCPGSIGRLRRMFYIQYCDRMMRRYCADIAFGWDDDTAGICENFAGPPNITNHGINGIVIAGGRRSQERRHFTPSHYRTEPWARARHWGRRLHRPRREDLRRNSGWGQRQDRRQLRCFPGCAR